MLESRVILTETGQRRVLMRGASSWHEECARPTIYLRALSTMLAGLILVSGALLLLQMASTWRQQSTAPLILPIEGGLSNPSNFAASNEQIKSADKKSSLQISDARVDTQWFRPASEAAEVSYTASTSTQPKAPATVTVQPKPQSDAVSAPLQDQTVPDDTEPIISARSQQKLHSDDVAVIEAPSAQQVAQPELTKKVAAADGKLDTEAANKKAPPLPTRKDYTYARQLTDASGDERASPSRTRSRTQPMALAPPNAAPKHVTLSGYNGRVFGALARHKPKVGRRGSTKVAFAIGAGGQLAFVRVVGSSGDTSLDRLAVAAVRKAAPFPRPPAGPVTYSIRIYFR
jgi:protein TonB